MLKNLPEGYRWQFLWETVKRYFYYFRAINKGYLKVYNPEFELLEIDVVMSFFILCFQLKDWIKRDCGPIVSEKVEIFVETTRLKECQAIANGLKHLNLTGPGFNGNTITLISKEQEPERRAIKFWISSGDNREDAFLIAKECIELWRKFIRENIEPGDLFYEDFEVGKNTNQ